MKIALIIIAVFVVALFSIGIALAISLYKQRAQQKEEPERLQKKYAKQYSPASAPMLKPGSRAKVASQPVVFQKHRSVGFTSGNQQGSASYDPIMAVAITSSDMGSSSSHSSGGYSGGSSCSGGDSSSSSSSDSSSSSCD